VVESIKELGFHDADAAGNKTESDMVKTLKELGLSDAVFALDCSRPVRYGGFTIVWTVTSEEASYTISNKETESKVLVLSASLEPDRNLRALVKEGAKSSADSVRDDRREEAAAAAIGRRWQPGDYRSRSS
jgi:hypothetical protein